MELLAIHSDLEEQHRQIHAAAAAAQRSRQQHSHSKRYNRGDSTHEIGDGRKKTGRDRRWEIRGDKGKKGNTGDRNQDETSDRILVEEEEEEDEEEEEE